MGQEPWKAVMRKQLLEHWPGPIGPTRETHSASLLPYVVRFQAVAPEVEEAPEEEEEEAPLEIEVRWPLNPLAPPSLPFNLSLFCSNCIHFCFHSFVLLFFKHRYAIPVAFRLTSPGSCRTKPSHSVAPFQ